ncbi:hypothetical protein [Nocardia sp. NBC_00511]|uniref:hypothetical protein n=1 Tax=Nocardia sp. NBC_00511 TaxID=2903591 RepID=UPI0030DFB5FB
MVEAWNRQSGSGTFDVIFDGNIYRNHWEVEPKHCPGDVAAVPEGNPWRWLREATTDEMTTIGNPTTCEPATIEATPGEATPSDATPAAPTTTDAASAEPATTAEPAAPPAPTASNGGTKPAAAQ